MFDIMDNMGIVSLECYYTLALLFLKNGKF